MADVRKYTNRLLEKIELGYISWEDVARECLSEMSEGAVESMCDTTEWVNDSDFEEEENSQDDRF